MAITRSAIVVNLHKWENSVVAAGSGLELCPQLLLVDSIADCLETVTCDRSERISLM